MALTWVVDDHQLNGTKRQKRGTVTFDSSYPTNGEAFTPADIGMTAITDIQFDGDDGYTLVWDRSVSAPKIVARWSGGSGAVMAEVTNATNLSAVVSRFCATGY